uniref:Uncharacterized protein n=1 Tax=Cucumis melo TaxID=3656 RepID=A0A9I9CM56_CUCME
MDQSWFNQFRSIDEVVTLRRQVDYFKEMERSLRKKLGTSKTKTLLSTAVYLIAIGSGDYDAFDPKSNSLYQSYTTQQYVDSVIGNMTRFIKEIYKTGGTKEVKSGCRGSGAFRGKSSCGGMRGIKEYELCKNPEEHSLACSDMFMHVVEEGNQSN